MGVKLRRAAMAALLLLAVGCFADNDEGSCALENDYDGPHEVDCPGYVNFKFVSHCSGTAYANSTKGETLYNLKEIHTDPVLYGHTGSGNYSFEGDIYCHEMERTIEISNLIYYGTQSNPIDDCKLKTKNVWSVKVNAPKQGLTQPTFKVFSDIREMGSHTYHIDVGQTITLTLILQNLRNPKKYLDKFVVGSSNNVVIFTAPDKSPKPESKRHMPPDMLCLTDSLKNKKLNTVTSMYTWKVCEEHTGRWDWDVDIYDGIFYRTSERLTFYVGDPQPPTPTPDPDPEPKKYYYIYVFGGIGCVLFGVALSAAVYIIAVTVLEFLRSKRRRVRLMHYEEIQEEEHIDDEAGYHDSKRELLLSSVQGEGMVSVRENDSL